MTETRFATPIILILYLVFSGCTIKGVIIEEPVESMEETIKPGADAIEFRIRAENSMREGNLPAAGMLWKIVETIEGPSDEVSRIKKLIKEEIEKKVKINLEIAAKALAEHKSPEAKRALLKVLWANPDHKPAVEQLRKIEKDTLRKTRSKINKKLLRKRKNPTEIKIKLKELKTNGS